MSDATELVDRQVDAYNTHDVATFAACYHPDAIIRDGDGTTLMYGAAAIRERYTAFFAEHPDVAARIDARIEVGDWIIDREVVVLRGVERIAAAAYHVVEGGIDRVVLLG